MQHAGSPHFQVNLKYFSKVLALSKIFSYTSSSSIHTGQWVGGQNFEQA